jgi:hypothetical protein
MPDPLKFVD